ncbi:hypothetical protein SLS60_005964 [Paraconiothyrium brasiliense]|uniref:RING-type domain-containing protein n=1 Tax=Paraconiothyrium brasiliense TaxID=300254 RepID=A0ABR3REC6_9PLEO
MADNPALPMRDYFLANYISIVHDCGICQEKFDHDEHAPARLCGPNSCNHMFGASCLTTWLNSRMPGANTCPMCRKELFVSENDEYDSDDNDAEDGIFPRDQGRSLDDEYDDDMYSEDSEDDGEMDIPQVEAIFRTLENQAALRHAGGDRHGGGPTNIQEAVNNGHEEGNAAEDDEIAGVHLTNLENIDAPLRNPLDQDSGWNLNNVDKDREDGASDPERKPVFCDGFSGEHEASHDLGLLWHWPDAAAFTKKLWGELYMVYGKDHIFEDDIELQVHAALRHSDASDHDYTSIGYREWPAVLEVARDMIREHFRNRDLVALDHKAMDYWLGRLGDALGWGLCDSYGDSCRGESDNELPCKGFYANGW